MDVKIGENVAPMSPRMAADRIPLAAAAMVFGAHQESWHEKKDAMSVMVGGEEMVFHVSDYGVARAVADLIGREWQGDKVNVGDMVVPMPSLSMKVVRLCQDRYRSITDTRAGKMGIVMLKDKGASGWWRMAYPARFMETDGWYVDISAAEVGMDQLMEYDTIHVQRVHDWESHAMLRKLKQAGKHIVYDIDDDLFNITPDNPAWHIIGRDHQEAAAECMRLADVVVASTDELADRITSVVTDVDMVTVIPNALDLDDGWLPTALTGSPDDIKRVLWTGGASHAVDWEQCAGAVEEIMDERNDVHLVILGFLPPAVERMAERFADRIEFLGFRDPDTYMKILHHVRAEAALAPLRSTPFNACKTPIKFLEYSCAGIPTVASDCLPYDDVIDDKKSGRLVETPDEWKKALEWYLDHQSGRREAVDAARKTCRDRFDVKAAAKHWEQVLCSSE